MKMINVRNIKKSYEHQVALNDISFDIHEGKIYGFIGRNGAGKTTMLNILAGLIRPDEGEISSEDESMVSIGYLPEEPVYYAWMTPLEYISYLSKNECEDSCQKLLSFVGLHDHQKRRIGRLSRGMKQRLGLACALVNHPKLILLDEPASALDPQGRYDLLDRIKLLKEQGKTVVFSSHILHDVERIADEIILIEQGQLMMKGKTSDILNQFSNEMIKIKYSHIKIDEFVIYLQQLLDVKHLEVKEHELYVHIKHHDVFINIITYLADHHLIVDEISFDRPTLEQHMLEVTSHHAKST